MLGSLLELALLIGLIWLLLRWLLPYLRPRINAWFGLTPAAPSAFEILRQRYAAGQIDAWTFERMWERLEASYQHEHSAVRLDAPHYRREVARQRARRTQRLARATRKAEIAQRRKKTAFERERHPIRVQRAIVPD